MLKKICQNICHLYLTEWGGHSAKDMAKYYGIHVNVTFLKAHFFKLCSTTVLKPVF